MIRQAFNVESYWKVVVWYNLDYNLFYLVEKDLKNVGISEENLRTMQHTMYSRNAKAVTLSSISKHISVVLFNSHKSKTDYINSIVHEAEHIKQAMLQAYDVDDSGESPAYTIGYLVGRMWEVFKDLVCITCKHT